MYFITRSTICGLLLEFPDFYEKKINPLQSSDEEVQPLLAQLLQGVVQQSGHSNGGEEKVSGVRWPRGVTISNRATADCNGSGIATKWKCAIATEMEEEDKKVTEQRRSRHV